MKFLVKWCAPYECPFFYADQEHKECTATFAYRDLSAVVDRKPPDFCPLRAAPVKVHL